MAVDDELDAAVSLLALAVALDALSDALVVAVDAEVDASDALVVAVDALVDASDALVVAVDALVDASDALVVAVEADADALLAEFSDAVALASALSTLASIAFDCVLVTPVEL